jgi:hypothetical protein
MPPGLYEAVITDLGPDAADPNLVQGRYLFTLEARTLGDIRALGVNGADDEKRFSTVARLSEVNQGLYVTAVQPIVRQMVTEQSAQLMRRLHPHRVRFESFSDRNPLIRGVQDVAAAVREHRMPVSEDNPLLAVERQMSDWIVQALDRAAEARDAWQEAAFTTIYGWPALQALMGLRGEHAVSTRHAERDWAREAAEQRAITAADERLTAGGAAAVAARALLFILWPARKVDERAFAMMQSIANEMPAEHRVDPASFKQVLREQALVLMTDEGKAIEAIPRMLTAKGHVHAMIFDAVRRVVTSGGPLPAACQARLAKIKALLNGKHETPAAERRLRAVAGE